MHRIQKSASCGKIRLALLLFFGAVFVWGVVILFGSRFTLAFRGPTSAAGIGSGALGVDSSNNVAFGTSTARADTKLFILASSTDAGNFALRVLQPNEGNLFLIRNDGKISIASAVVGTNTLSVGGNANVSGTVTATSFSGPMSATVSADNVTPGVFNNGTGGNYAFNGSLGVATTTQVGLPQALSVYGNGYLSGSLGVGTANPLDAISLGILPLQDATRALVNLTNSSLVGGNSSGTFIGANPSSFNGNFINFQTGGATQFRVMNSGKIQVGSSACHLEYANRGVALQGGCNKGSSGALVAFNNPNGAWTDSGNFTEQWLLVQPNYIPGATSVSTTVTVFQVDPTFNPSGVAPIIGGQWVAADIKGIYGSGDEFYNATSALVGLQIRPSINIAPGSSGKYVAFLVNPAETSVPSGAVNLLADFQNGGASKMVITSAGNVGIGTGNPTSTLTVAGEIKTTSGGVRFPDGTIQTTAGGGGGGGSQWTTTSTGIYYSGGNVGIGTQSPLDALSLGAAPPALGTRALVNLSNTTLSSGSANGTYIGANPSSFSGNFIHFQTGGTSRLRIDNAGRIIFGSSGGAAQIEDGTFRQQGSFNQGGSGSVWEFNQTNGAWTDAGSFTEQFLFLRPNYQPSAASVATNISILDINPQAFNPSAVAPTITGQWILLNVQGTYGSGDELYNAASPLVGVRIAPAINLGTGSTGKYTALLVNPTETSVPAGSTNLLADFQVGGASRAVITASGNVGIGTATPQSALQVGSNYIQFPVISGAAPSGTDCDAAAEYGRVVVRTDGLFNLYVCTSAGWVVK